LTLGDRVELPKLVLAWHSPPQFAPGDAEMDLVASIFAEGKQSRLRRKLVHEDRLAFNVEAYQWSRPWGSLFVVEVTGRTGVDLARLETATLKLVARFLLRPPLKSELERVKNSLTTGFVADLQRLQRRAELLNFYYQATGEPDGLALDLARYQRASLESVHRWGLRVLKPERCGIIQVAVEAEAAKRGEA
jgi:predicted Zn-dependent peptidase